MRLRSGFSFSARLLQLYFVIGILALSGFWFFYSQATLIRLSRLWRDYAGNLAVQLENDTQLRSSIYAKFMSRITEPSSGGSPELDIIFEEVIKKIDFPVVITDRQGRAVSHRNLPFDNPGPEQLEHFIVEMDSHHRSIPLLVEDGDSTRRLGEIHYGLSGSTMVLRRLNSSLSDSVRALRLFSVLQVLLLAGFVTVGVWGLLVYKRREQEHIWTALAKETAHQLATPLSSFAAWVEMLRSDEKREVMEAMGQDVERMKEILDRFSRIGLPPKLSPQPVGPMLERSVAFVRRRAPRTVKFGLTVRDDPEVMVDGVLLSWTVENLLKNSVDAIGTREGGIAVSVFLADGGRVLEIEVADTGEGVKVEKVFKPGVTTKKYGWGVGLALAKRIVEDYHGGRIALKESKPGRTVFSICLPVVEERAG